MCVYCLICVYVYVCDNLYCFQIFIDINGVIMWILFEFLNIVCNRLLTLNSFIFVIDFYVDYTLKKLNLFFWYI